MKKEYTEEELFQIAKKRINKKKNLYSHIVSYILVNLFLMFIYFMDEKGFHFTHFFWPGIVMGIWGIGLITDIIETIQDLNFKHGSKAIDKEMEKIKRQIKDE